MSGSVEKSMDRAIKDGAVLAEVSSLTSTRNEQKIDTIQPSPIAKAVLGFASVAFEVRAHYLETGASSNC